MDQEQRSKIAHGAGFLAALDQSGGSTPKALSQYGVDSFDGTRVLGAILFDQTMDRDISGIPSPQYLWERKNVVPFVKVDEGLAEESDGVRLMKPITKLETLLDRAVSRRVFGTKMRSFVASASRTGINAVVDQQFEYASRILDAGLVPILEPEVDIHSPAKLESEVVLKQGILDRLADLPAGRQVMLKLSIPSVDDFYADVIGHPRVLRVVALSGGYSQQEADELLARNHGLIASFSRALVQDLHRDQSDADFDHTLDEAITAIYRASLT